MNIRLLLLLSLFLLVGATARAQKKVPARAVKQHREAMRLLSENHYTEAEHKLSKLFKRHPHYVSAGVTLGDLYIRSKQLEQAKQTYTTVLRNGPDFSYRPYFQLGKMSLTVAEYKEAKFYFEQTLKFTALPANTLQDAGLYLNQCNFALEALANPVSFVPINMGDSINSAFDEYLPALTADDETILFTRKMPEGEDFYISHKDAKGDWSLAQPLPPPLNTTLNEGAHCLSSDGKTIYFTACYRNSSLGGCDLYVSTLTPTGWSVPLNLGDKINTQHWETQPSISFDGSTLYFVSNRPGGFGGSDIWVSKRSAAGAWDTPENMGPYINSRKDEISPFIHYDDQTLYFASEGMAGMGGLDIYLSKRMEDGEFGPARNLGYPINTEKDESSLFVNLSGTLALFSSESGDSRGRNDIFYFELPEELRPEKAIYLKGKVLDAQNNRPLESTIEVVDLASGDLVFQSTTFERDGVFLVSLPAGHSFAFNASATGYLFYSENITVDDAISASEYYLLKLQPIEKGSAVILKNIFYEVNAFALQERSLIELRKLKSFLVLNPSVVIEIQGHTDNIGSRSYNQELSTQRAKNVYEALVRFGVDAKQMRYKGYGDSQPLADNTSEGGRSRNRRTQFMVLEVN